MLKWGGFGGKTLGQHVARPGGTLPAAWGARDPHAEGPWAAWPQTAEGAAPRGRGCPHGPQAARASPGHPCGHPCVMLGASGENQPGAVLWPDRVILVKNVICRPQWVVNQNADVGPLRVLREGQRRAPAGSGLEGLWLAPAGAAGPDPGAWGCPQPAAPQGSRGQATAAGPGPAPAPLGIPARHRVRPPGTATERGAVELRGLALSWVWGPDPLGWAPPGPAGRGRGCGAAAAGPACPCGFVWWFIYLLKLFPPLVIYFFSFIF